MPRLHMARHRTVLLGAEPSLFLGRLRAFEIAEPSSVPARVAAKIFVFEISRNFRDLKIMTNYLFLGYLVRKM